MEENNIQTIELEPYDSKSGKGFKKIFKSFSFLTFGKLIGDFFTFILFVVLSRKFGQEGVGQYSFATGLTGFFAICADFGLYSYTVKEISRHRNLFGDYFQKIFSLRIVQSTLVVLILLPLVPLLNFSITTKTIIIIIGIYQIICSFIDGVSAIFIAHELMHISGGIEASLKIITSLSALLIAFLGGDIVSSLLALPLVAIIQLFIVFIILRKKFGKIKILFSSNSLITTFKNAIPFGTSDFLTQLYGRIDVVLIGFLLGESFAGIYNVGYRTIFFLLFIPRFASITLFPIVSKLFNESKFEFQKMYNKSLNMIIIIAVPISAGLCLVAPDFIKLVFSSKFIESANILRLLSSLFLINCLSNIMEIFLMASDHQKTRVKSQWITSCVSVLTNLTLILLYNVEGAAIAVVISSLLLVTLYILKLKPIVGFPDIKSKILISSLGVLIFYSVFSIEHFSIFIIIPGAVILYLGTIMLFKNIRKNELRMILDLTRKKNS